MQKDEIKLVNNDIIDLDDFNSIEIDDISTIKEKKNKTKVNK